MVEFTNNSETSQVVEETFIWLSEKIQSLLPNASIEHIGSTAVPGALTKGDVDVQVTVEKDQFQLSREILDAKFDHNPGMEPTETFVSYSGVFQSIHFGIQLIQPGENYFNFLKWRDALRNSPELLERYNQIKLKMASKSEVKYRQAKSDFIEEQLDTI